MIMPRDPPPGRNWRRRVWPCRTRSSMSTPVLVPLPQGPPPPPLLDWLAIWVPFLQCGRDRQILGGPDLPTRSDCVVRLWSTLVFTPSIAARFIGRNSFSGSAAKPDPLAADTKTKRRRLGSRTGSLCLCDCIVKVRVVKPPSVEMIDGNTRDSVLGQRFVHRRFGRRGHLGDLGFGCRPCQVGRVSGRDDLLRAHGNLQFG